LPKKKLFFNLEDSMKISNGEFQESHFTATGQVTLRGEPVAYEVVSEDNVLVGDDGKPAGSIFSFSYFRTGLADGAPRPVVFVYNGGPGSACIWQHLGLFGPRRVRLEDAVHPPTTPPYELDDNPHSPLDVCDIVMVDPVETGYGRLLNPEAAEQFFGIDTDANVMALFIESWLTRYKRWDSKIYLAGESYGTVRNCVLANALMAGPTSPLGRLVAISVSGILMLGPAVSTSGYIFQEGVESSVIKLPSLAAIAWYHRPAGKPDLETFVEEAYRFSYETYLKALFLGDRMGPAERDEVIRRLVCFTGLDDSYFREHDLRVSKDDFVSMLLKDEGCQVGTYDGRYKLKQLLHTAMPDVVSDDPAMGQYTPAFTGAMNGPLKIELNITFDREYKAINFAINEKWKNESQRTPLQNLLAAMRRNEDLRVFFGTGYYDLATELGGVRYTVSHMGMPAGRVVVKEYPSGHMPYLGEESATILAADIREFIR
jgi:carboxypeptidase C (cathepsin A)